MGFLLSLRESSISSWAEGNPCCTHVLGLIAKTFWRRSPRCTNCTCLLSEVVSTRTPLQVNTFWCRFLCFCFYTALYCWGFRIPRIGLIYHVCMWKSCFMSCESCWTAVYLHAGCSLFFTHKCATSPPRSIFILWLFLIERLVLNRFRGKCAGYWNCALPPF